MKEEMEFTHPTIDSLERYALNVGDLPDEETRLLREHLDQCIDCRERLSEMKEFYNEVFTGNVDDIDTESARVVAAVTGSHNKMDDNVIELYPRAKRTHIRSGEPYVIALAAMDKANTSHYTTVETLSSADEQVLLRIVRDNERKKLILQVHADKPSNFAHVLITFDAIPGIHLTDEAGELVLDEFEELPHHLHAFVRPPLCTFYLKDLDRERLMTGHNALLTGENESTISIRLSGKAVILNYSDEDQLLNGKSPRIAYKGINGIHWSTSRWSYSEIPIEAFLDAQFIAVY